MREFCSCAFSISRRVNDRGIYTRFGVIFTKDMEQDSGTQSGLLTP
jgi:hypothetical protein